MTWRNLMLAKRIPNIGSYSIFDERRGAMHLGQLFIKFVDMISSVGKPIH